MAAKRSQCKWRWRGTIRIVLVACRSCTRDMRKTEVASGALTTELSALYRAAAQAVALWARVDRDDVEAQALAEARLFVVGRNVCKHIASVVPDLEGVVVVHDHFDLGSTGDC